MKPRIASMVLVAAFAVGCSSSPGPAETEPNDQSDSQEQSDDNQGPDACERGGEIPAGISYALNVDEIVEPEGVVDVVGRFMDDVPPVLLFVDGLDQGEDDDVKLVAGTGESTGFGDAHLLHTGIFDEEACAYLAEFEGAVSDRSLFAAADSARMEVGMMLPIIEGMTVGLSDIEVTGDFTGDLTRLDGGLLSGTVAEEQLDELIESLRQEAPISEDQLREILDPDDDGEVQIELKMSGPRAVVDGFVDPDAAGDDVEARQDAGPCCPDDLQVGDSVIPELAWTTQGLQPDQVELFQMALPEFRADPHIAMVATAVQRDDGTVHYEVYSGGAVDKGEVVFERRAGDDADSPQIEIVGQSGRNPLVNTDPSALSTYEKFADVALNPGGVSYVNRGYGLDDDRVGFVPADEMDYPFGYQRIAQAFDDPRAGDLLVIPASWSTGGFGTHGNLGALQSRTPLVMAGPGIRSADEDPDTEGASVEQLAGGGQALMLDRGVRQTDIAPTVAAALGIDDTVGVGPDMRLRDDVRLGWQDGRVLEEVFTDEARALIEQGEPVAERVIIFVNDGFTQPELFHHVFSGDEAVDTDVYEQLFESGAAFRYGAFSTFPSNTFPGHNAIGSGAWSGHHGIVNNRFWIRDQGLTASPIGQIFDTEYLFGSAHPNLPVETLHEAVGRTFGGVDDGELAASINNPSTRGADFATYERRIPEGFELPPEADQIRIGDQIRELPDVDPTDQTELMDNSTVQNFAALFQDHRERPDEGLPIPRFTILNLASTDTAGHVHGPHGDDGRHGALARTHRRMALMFDVLEDLEVDDSTLVVLTADHGMELQDASRSSSRTRPLSEAGIAHRTGRAYVYFKQLSVDVEHTVVDGGETRLSLRVVDRDTAAVDEPVGVEGVEVSAVNEQGIEPAATDADGRAVVRIPNLVDESGVLFAFEHPQWNTLRKYVTIEH